MLISNKAYKELKEGIITKDEMIAEIIKNYPIQLVVEDYVNLLLSNREDNVKIVVDKDEYERILSLFKVRGYKDRPLTICEMVTETRGRKPKTNKD